MTTQELREKFNLIDDKYEILSLHQKISNTQSIFKARCKNTGWIVSIKQEADVLRSSYECKRVTRQISILRQLSEISNNVFTPKLIDVVVPIELNEDGDQGFKDVYIVTNF